MGELFADRKFAFCLALAVVVRISVFVGIIWFPLTNEKGELVSALHYSTGTDLVAYKSAQKVLFGSDLGQVFHSLWTGKPDSYKELIPETGWQPLPHEDEHIGINRPVFPVLLQITGYSPGNTLQLAIVYLCISIIWVSLWMIWLRRKRLNLFWITVFGLLPVPIWFTINISTDLLFAAIVLVFWLTLERGKLLWVVIFIALGILTRPNGFSLLLFLVFYFTLIHGKKSNRVRFVTFIACVSLGISASIFYWNDLYIFAFATNYKAYFGYSQLQFLSGIYGQLPAWINLPASWFSLLGLKMLFFVGIRPSFSDAGLFIVLIRSAAGLILFPGLIWSFVAGSNQIRLFLLCFLIPIFCGLAQERYMLPILPIVFYFGTLALKDSWRYIYNRIEAGAARKIE